jgi:hypothetical protein
MLELEVCVGHMKLTAWEIGGVISKWPLVTLPCGKFCGLKMVKYLNYSFTE